MQVILSCSTRWIVRGWAGLEHWTPKPCFDLLSILPLSWGTTTRKKEACQRKHNTRQGKLTVIRGDLNTRPRWPTLMCNHSAVALRYNNAEKETWQRECMHETRQAKSTFVGRDSNTRSQMPRFDLLTILRRHRTEQDGRERHDEKKAATQQSKVTVLGRRGFEHQAQMLYFTF